MTRVTYKVGDHTTTNYAEALRLKEELNLPLKRCYSPVKKVETPQQAAARKARCAKVAEVFKFEMK